jgi:Putative prokaryotic signal transducing protein
MDAEETVVVYGTNDVYEAEIIRNSLRAAGIACELEGELQGGFTGLVETRLLVPAGDADRARRLIKRRTIDGFAPPTDERIHRG